MVVKQALFFFVLTALIVPAISGCGKPATGKMSFIDTYLGINPFPTTSREPIPSGKRHSVLDEPVEEHPELISEISLPRNYYSDKVLENKLRIASGYIRKQSYFSAKKELMAFLRRRPDDPYASFLLSLAFQGLADYPREEKMLIRTLELDRKHAFANYNYGYLKLKSGNPVEALYYFDNCISELPLHPGANYNKAIIALQWNRFEVAVRFLRICAEISPYDYRVFNNLGVACERSGRTAQAEAHYMRAYYLSPKAPEVLDNLSAYLLSQKRYDEALDIANKWREVAGAIPACFYRLACISSLQDDQKAAHWFLKEALAAGYKDIEWIASDPDLKGLLEKYPDILESAQ